MVSKKLLSDLKNHLDITWEDDATNEKLKGILSRGMKYINQTAGRRLDYARNDKPKELLFEYARYARSNALEAFQTNYLHELLSLQIAVEVNAYVATKDTDV